MTNATIGHYASHPGGGYQPPKTDKVKFQNPPRGIGLGIAQISDIEMRIRKEVMSDIAEIIDKLYSPEIPCTKMKTLAYAIQDRLKLLWNEQ